MVSKHGLVYDFIELVAGNSGYVPFSTLNLKSYLGDYAPSVDFHVDPKNPIASAKGLFSADFEIPADRILIVNGVFVQSQEEWMRNRALVLVRQEDLEGILRNNPGHIPFK